MQHFEEMQLAMQGQDQGVGDTSREDSGQNEAGEEDGDGELDSVRRR